MTKTKFEWDLREKLEALYSVGASTASHLSVTGEAYIEIYNHDSSIYVLQEEIWRQLCEYMSKRPPSRCMLYWRVLPEIEKTQEYFDSISGERKNPNGEFRAYMRFLLSDKSVPDFTIKGEKP